MALLTIYAAINLIAALLMYWEKKAQRPKAGEYQKKYCLKLLYWVGE